ncbi:DUF2321 domain-containing protein [Weizmannia sp. FSL K6-0777]|uniref:DUF2321 domain-containing protein n=1 Tax=Heyndrickxia TaxID=2837504 RepID=UPI002E1D3AC5|nr:DUF2321 domain-containing protein [Weizmannia sp. CD-2023]
MSIKTAQICLNGHIVNGNIEEYPEHNKNFCPYCGEKTISKCSKCGTRIKGDESSDDDSVVFYISMSHSPKFCPECGNPFPWTKKEIEAAKEYADLIDKLNDEEKEQLKGSIDDMIQEGPRTKLGVAKFKKFITKAGADTAQAFKDILVDVLSESVKKSLWG